MPENQLIQCFYLTIGAIAGVRVFIRMSSDQLSLLDSVTRSAAIEVVASEMTGACTVMLLFI